MILSASHAGCGIVGVIRGVKLDQSGKPLAHHQKVQMSYKRVLKGEIYYHSFVWLVVNIWLAINHTNISSP